MPNVNRVAADKPWAAGIAAFAAIMLTFAGLSQAFLGLAALVNGTVFVHKDGYLYTFDTTVWGLIHLVLGALFVLIGIFILQGRSWAIWTGIIIVVVNGVLNVLWLPVYPIGAVLLVAVDVLIIWALTSVNRRSAT